MLSISRNIALSSSAFLAFSAVASADTYHWIGANSSHTVFTDSSWLSGSAPPNSRVGTELIFSETRGGTGLEPDYDLEGGAILASQILFARGDTNGFFNGRVNLAGDFKNEGLGHVYSSEVRLSGDSLIWAEKGDITLQDGLSLGGRNVELRAGFYANDLKTITIYDSISGNYYSGSGITKTGSGTLELYNSSSTYSAPFVLEEGELLLSRAGALSTSSPGLTAKPGTIVTVGSGVSISDRKVDLQGTLFLDGVYAGYAHSGTSWSFDEGLNLTGDSVKVLSNAHPGSVLGGGSAIPLTGKKLVLSARTNRILEIEKDIEVDPEGGVFELEIGSISAGEEGEVKLDTAVRQLPGSSGSFGTLSLLSGKLETTAAGASISEFSAVVLHEDTVFDAHLYDPVVQNLQGEGDVELFVGGSLTANYDEGETFFAGDVTGDHSDTVPPEFLIQGSGTLVYSGTIDTNQTTVAGSAELRLDGGTISAAATNRLTVEAGGTLSGTGGAGYSTIHGTVSPGHASSGLMEA